MPNQLRQESSPYLRQHADNPVDWRPWSADALAAARAQDKPILLSIGYSACHWCHVMAHESFEDEATARLMNDLYINIKVDREERPDLDKIYQLAHQAFSGRGGGWPLTVFLAPEDLVPFYAGTYFPKAARYGMPPFAHVLQQVRAFWDERRGDVGKQTAALQQFLTQHNAQESSDAEFSDTPLRVALQTIASAFDTRYGGRQGAPKFPHCAEMELLLETDGDNAAMVDLTLQRIFDGGIHDQLGGGFCRYSVDERWEIPHFEKMLYDNAQLLSVYALRARATGNPDFEVAARGILAWLDREMLLRAESAAVGCAFFSALDADSQGHEGKFYVWQREAIRALLEPDEFAVAERYFGLDRAANFEGDAWNLILAKPLREVAAVLAIDYAVAQKTLEVIKSKLLAARSMRVRPGLDDKILTAWNALLVAALARASRALAQPEMAHTGAKILDFLHANVWRDGRLFACFAGGSMKFPAYLDDHAFLLDALLEQLKTRWSERDLRWTTSIADAMIERFEDAAAGGFFFTAHDHEPLPQRPKSFTDDATPAGNGVAVRALLRVGHLLGEPRYLDVAERALRAGYSMLVQAPEACPSMLRALREFLHPRTHVVIRAALGAEAQTWHAAMDRWQSSTVDFYWLSADDIGLSATLDAQTYRSGGVAYVCRGTQCLAPIDDVDVLERALETVI